MVKTFKKFKIQTVLLGLWVIACGLGTLKAANAMTLEDALVLSYQNNPTLLAQRALVRATDEQVSQALSGWRPEIEGSVRSNTFWNRRNNDNNEINRRSGYQAQVTVTQNIFQGGQTLAATEEAESRVRAERARLVSTEQSVLLNTVTAYMDVFRDGAVLKLTMNNEKVLARQLEATQDRFNVGEVTRTDVAQAEARLSGAQADRIQAEGNLKTSRGVFRQIVGVKARDLNKPDPALELPSDAKDAIRLAIENSPVILAAKFDEAAALHNANEITGELLPSLDLIGQATKGRNQSVLNRDNTDYELRAQLTVPIYQQGSVFSRVREAKQLHAQSRMQIEEARRQAVEEATSGWEALSTARARIESLKAEVRAAQIALEGVQQEALVGSRTVLNVLDAEQELLDAKVDLVKAERDEVVARFDVMSATGRLTGPALKLPSGYYDTNVHHKAVQWKIFGLGNDIGSYNVPNEVKKP